jgi:large subunit ribosomal protein L6
MSKIGQKPITIPNSVEVAIDHREVRIKGPKGDVSFDLPRELTINKEENILVIQKESPVRYAQALWGLWRSLIANAVQGVSEGFNKQLELVGVGYRAGMKGKDLELQLGFSHPVVYNPPEGITLSVEGPVITISGADKQQVGQVAAKIRGFRRPEPYKGKGIRYVGENIRRKAGKTGKASA